MIAEAIRWIIRKVNGAQHEAERKKIDKDPVDWFTKHFSGDEYVVRPVDSVRDQADEANTEREPE